MTHRMQEPRVLVTSTHSRAPAVWVSVGLAAVFLSAGCVGTVGSQSHEGENADDPGEDDAPGMPGGSGFKQDPGEPPRDVVEACDRKQPGSSPARLWRLSDAQIENSLNALVPGGAEGISNPFAGADSGRRFRNYAQDFGVPEPTADTLVRAAGTFAPRWQRRLAAVHACAADFTADCAAKLVADAGRQAFRRPLTNDEVDEYAKLMLGQKAVHGNALAIQTGLEAILLSPHFVFRSEVGAGQPDASGRVKLTPHEVAAAISYTTIDAPPDAALNAAADEGRLGTPDEVRAQVLRLLDRMPENAAASRFMAEYFMYRGADQVFKDPARAPHHDAEALIASTDAWFQDALAVDDSFLEHVLTSPVGFVNAATAETFGLPGIKASGADGFARVDLPGTQRAGILTQPSFLVKFSKNDETDPIERGKFIARSLLCSGLPDVAPPNVPALADLGPNATVRERLAVHRESDGSCRACHDLMDPLGLGLEAYDDTGRFRTTEQGKPVDTSGEIVGTVDQDGPFNGGVELGQRLAASTTVRQCFVRHAFKFWMGREEQDADACTLADADSAYGKGAGSLRDIVVALLASDTFLYRHRDQ